MYIIWKIFSLVVLLKEKHDLISFDLRFFIRLCFFFLYFRDYFFFIHIYILSNYTQHFTLFRVSSTYIIWFSIRTHIAFLLSRPAKALPPAPPDAPVAGGGRGGALGGEGLGSRPPTAVYQQVIEPFRSEMEFF